MAARKAVVLSTGVRTRTPEQLGKLELWELGRRALGYGDWQPDHPEPYQKWSGMESHKLFLVMRKRGIKNADFVLAVEYCQRHHKRIENAIWVFRFLPDAQQERREWLAQNQLTDLGQEIETALGYERALSDDMSASWIGQLTRARGPYRREVLELWKAERQS